MQTKDKKIKLCDFGLGEFFKSSNDVLTGATKGTYLFMAPEMVDVSRKKKGVYARAGDIWACGVTLFNLLTKEHPFSDKNLVGLQQKLLYRKPDLSLIDEKLGADHP